MKRIYFILALVFGIIFFGILSFVLVKSSKGILPISDARILQSISASICASFIFLFAINTLEGIRGWIYRRAFKSFFGEISSSTTAHLVYPDFKLSDQVKSVIQDIDPTDIFRKRADHYPGTRFIDVPKIVASNDLLGIVIAATRLGRYIGDSPKLITDGQAVDDPGISMISFGLTSNAVTDLYLRTDPKPLFQLRDVEKDPIIIVDRDGKIEKFHRDETHQHAIVLRYRPNPIDYPKRFWIICAGLAAAGTPAAAWNLVHKWKQYNSRFDKNDFLIILRTSNDVHSYIKAEEIISIERKPAEGINEEQLTT